MTVYGMMLYSISQRDRCDINLMDAFLSYISAGRGPGESTGNEVRTVGLEVPVRGEGCRKYS